MPNEGDAWRYTVDYLSRYFERILTRRQELGEPRIPREPLVKLAAGPVPPLALELVARTVESARLLGERTAGLHLALAGDSEDPEFAPETIPPHYQRSLYQSVRSLASKTFQTLREQQPSLPQTVQIEAERAPELERRVVEALQKFLEQRVSFQRIRCHGDYHLGQVLYTGRDFVILDFEGEPARPLSERRLKRSALRDVAGMLRSFHYAVAFASRHETVREQDRPFLEGWDRFWQTWVSVLFMQGYLEAAGGKAFLPSSPEEMTSLLEVLVLEKTLYELLYELNNRPDWVSIPLNGLARIFEGPDAS